MHSVFWTGSAIILYVYVGYPLFLAIMARSTPRNVEKADIRPSVTLLVAAYNEETVIAEKIHNSLSLDYPKELFRIVVASDGSTDRTNEIVRRFEVEGIILMAFQQNRGKATALRDAMEAIDSEIVVMSDANTFYEPGAVKALVRNFSDSTVGAVSGDVILMNDHVKFGKGEGLFYKYERWIQGKETDIGSMVGVDGAMYALRRALYMPPGRDIILDDFVIGMNVARQKKRVVYESDAIGYEDTAPSGSEEFRRRKRLTVGAVQALRTGEGWPGSDQKMLLFKFLSHKFLRWCVPIFMLVVFFANMSLLHLPLYRGFFIVQCSVYLLAIMGAVSSRTGKLTSIPYYFMASQCAILVGIYLGFRGKQGARWQPVSRTLIKKEG